MADNSAPAINNDNEGEQQAAQKAQAQAQQDQVQHKKEEGTHEENNEGGEADESKKKSHGALENKEAIPVAGGERLGEKHWGESKIVPDNPKPAGGENVSSADGQPDDQTKSNTEKNSGSGEHEEGKESFVDKIKDKLHK